MPQFETFPELLALDKKLTAAFVGIELPESTYLDSEWVNAQTAEVIELVDQLDAYLCGEFIDSQGRHSNAYHQARRAGYTLRTGESDSWGPLTSVYTSIDGKWRLVFG